MATLGLIAAIVAGWLGWTGWLSIPIGILMFIGGLRARPDLAPRIYAVGIFGYVVGALIIMKVVGWLNGLI